ncbi:hypothetical protein FGU65_14175 [Methanoculleus sp. FWC-SCC1]|uniref:Uncharacterized protein n=1 Tax=Methanoculleus frigidifontis TaxID=2584085 RepID=A0ABT8MDK7_9EURY|nr:hypothetical protein [Methanoculleus sp. FWC-SCC1]MDN7026016.1 hypothetical protein [Methanoculleus sp. FWC-SCC1]
MAHSKSGSLKLLFLILVTLSCLVVGNAAATDVIVVEGMPNSLHPEGDVVDFTLKIGGLQPQVSKIEFETDLQPCNESPLWNITEPGFLKLPEGETIYNNQTLNFDILEDSSTPVIIHVVGKAPQITEVIQAHGLVITTRDPRKTGYTHYRVQSFDKDGFVVGKADTKVFNIEIPEEASYSDRLNAVPDQLLRDIIIDLHDKGLTFEANLLLDYSEAKPLGVSPLLVGIGLVIVAGVALLIGLRIGYARGYNASVRENEYKH